MGKSFIVSSYTKLSDIKLSTFAKGVVASMRGNANFPSPAPSLDELDAKNNTFSSAIIAVNMGDTKMIAAREAAREDLLADLGKLLLYVEMIANGSRAMLVNSGFEVNKEESSTVKLGEIENVKVTDGDSEGELLVSCDRVEGSKSYVYQYTLDPVTSDSVWASEPSTKSKHVFHSLISCKKYWCRIMAIGSNDQQTISPAVSRIVQ